VANRHVSGDQRGGGFRAADDPVQELDCWSDVPEHIEAEPDDRFEAEAGRYHLYVSYACPWAHRTLLIRALMGLEDAIDISVVDPYRDDDGWQFTPRRRGVPRTNSTGATISVNCTSRPTPTPPAG